MRHTAEAGKKESLSTISTQNLRSTTVGLDLGDRWSRYCVLNGSGDIVEENRVQTTAAGLEERFAAMSATRIVIEVGGHSPWVSRQLAGYGHEVVVANARKVRLIYETDRKNDRLDARILARLGRVDANLLAPVRHRSAEAQADLAVVRARNALVAARTQLINAARGLVKAMGTRLPKSTTSAFANKAAGAIPQTLLAALAPLVKSLRELNEQIHCCDHQIEALAEKKYPETRLLRQVKGVGALTALTYVLTLEDPYRFAKSRFVGCYLGLRPRQNQSGESAPQLGISKSGNGYLRRLLVQCSHFILGPFGSDSNLRRWGLQLASRGGKNGKKRAVVAVARKLAVLLHHLWSTAEVYEPLRGRIEGQAA
jgi:transposase